MKILYLNLCVLALLIINVARAKSFQKVCEDLENCVEEVSKMTGDKYFYSSKIKGSIKASSNVDLNKSNASTLLSHALFDNGYTRLRQKDGSYKIIDSRDVRYNPIKATKASFSEQPELPDNHDYHMMEYKLKSEVVEVGDDISRSLRPFISRYGRIMSVRSSNLLIVQDTAINLKRLYGLIKEMDKSPSKLILQSYKRKKKENFEIAKLEAKSCAPYKAELNELRKKCYYKEKKKEKKK